ncbi:hypothetical protein HZA56_18570 [Candidatus Poribacteria bacterium]|nr:hypothetical protein [Candidatus Poribacteria bacterium]
MAENVKSAGKRCAAVLLLLLLVAAGIRISIALCDTPTLVTKTLSDDSFYYFQLARNAASGRGITFDGVEPANGFHPLWFVLLLPVYALFGNGIAEPLHAALALEGLLDVGAGLLIYLLVKKLTDNRSAAISGAAVYLLNPSVILHSVNGLETGLNLFCFVLYFWFYLRMLDEDKFSARNILLLGLLSGILMLARTDNVIVVAVVYFHLFAFKLMPGSSAIRAANPPLPSSSFPFRLSPFAFRLLLFLASGVLCALVLSPWVIWNLLTFGSVTQSSGGAYSVITRGNLRAAGVTNFEIFLTSLSNTVRLFVWTIPSDVFGWGKIVGVLAGLAMGITLADEDRTKRAWAAARLACVPLFAFIALALTHSLVRGTLKSWYFMPAAAVGAIFFGILCSPFDFSSVFADRRGRLAGCFLAVLVLSGYALNGWTAWNKGMYPWQSEQVLAAQWIRENTPEDAWIGSFNSGIIGYLSERKVVNLDGLANNSVVPYLKERRLWDYIRERKIEYLIDSDYSILKDYRDFYGAGWRPGAHLLKVAVIDDPRVSWAGANVGVYRVIP